MATLKDVIRHNSVQLVEAFKKDLVRHSYTLWQENIVTEAVKDRVLDANSAGEDIRANVLVSNLSRKFEALEDMPEQVNCIKTLLKSLEGAGEMELVRKIRSEVKRDFDIEIQPFYSNPSSDLHQHNSGRVVRVPRQTQSDEHIEMFLEQDTESYFTEFEHPFELVSVSPDTHHLHLSEAIVLPIVPQKSSPTLQRQTVYHQSPYASHPASDPVYIGYEAPKKKHFRSKRFSAGQIPSNTNLKPQFAKRTVDLSLSPTIAENDFYQRPIQSPVQQQQSCNSILMKYEREKNELKGKLNKKNQEIIILKQNHVNYVGELWQLIQMLRSEVETKVGLAQQIADIETCLTQQHQQQMVALHSNGQTNVDLAQQIAGIETLLIQQHQQQREISHSDRSDIAKQISDIEIVLRKQNEKLDEKTINALQIQLKQEREKRRTCTCNRYVLGAVLIVIFGIVLYIVLDNRGATFH